MQQLDDRASLQDLDGMRVEVLPLPAMVAGGGLSIEDLRVGVERQLRDASIRIQRMGEFATGDPHLQIKVMVSDAGNGVVASSVEVGFVQIVFLRRNPMITFNRAMTWSAGGAIFLAPAARLVESIQVETSRQITQFILDYREANRKA